MCPFNFGLWRFRFSNKKKYTRHKNKHYLEIEKELIFVVVMMTESSSRYTLSQSLRHSHSVSVHGHNLVDPITGCPKVHVRSALLLPAKNNGPSLPKLPYDNSKEVVEETFARRSLHSRVLEKDPHAFKRLIYICHNWY